MSDQPTDNVTGVCDECTLPYTIELSDADQPQYFCSHDCEDANRRWTGDVRDEDYERAAARARSNDFEDTDGKDWT